MGDCPGPRKGTTTRRNVTRGVGKGAPCPPPPDIYFPPHPQIVMDPLYYIHLLEWAKLPPEMDVSGLGQMTTESIEGIQKSLSDSIQVTHNRMRLQCDFSAPHLIIPSNCYERQCFVTYVDFGTVALVTTQDSLEEQDVTVKEMKVVLVVWMWSGPVAGPQAGKRGRGPSQGLRGDASSPAANAIRNTRPPGHDNYPNLCQPPCDVVHRCSSPSLRRNVQIRRHTKLPCLSVGKPCAEGVRTGKS